MSDSTFTAELFSKGLLNRSLKEHLALPHHTNADKATIFLDNIEMNGVDFEHLFSKLLTVMENSDWDRMKELCKIIREKLDKNEDTEGTMRAVCRGSLKAVFSCFKYDTYSKWVITINCEKMRPLGVHEFVVVVLQDFGNI